jgi:repressor LexA
MKKTKRSDVLLPLTAKEKGVLEFIEGYMQEQGIAPSYQEIREHFGFASFNSVQRYLQQLETKKYIYTPGGNLKRAITILHSANKIQSSMSPGMVSGLAFKSRPFLKPESSPAGVETLALPLLGRVAAGRPIEAATHDEFVSVPSAWVRRPDITYALRVEGESMIEDGICDGDTIFVEKQSVAQNGDTVVAMIEQQATVKKFYLHEGPPEGDSAEQHKKSLLIHKYPQNSPHPEDAPKVELRPANGAMSSFWYRPDQIRIQGVVVGLIRRF